MTASVEDLYGLPLDEFTAARNALVAELKRKGDADAAASVKSLRKPPVTVWAVNQVARSHPDEVKELLAAGERLRRAQDELMGGSEPAALREATKSRRDSAQGLTQNAAETLQEAGTKPSRSQLDRISNTLLNAAIDDDARKSLATGTLTGDVDASAELGGVWSTASAPELDERPASAVRAARKEAERLGREADDAEALASELAGEAESARLAAERTMQSASDARRAALAARRRADEAQREV